MQGLTKVQWDFGNLLNLSIFLVMLLFVAVAGRIAYGGPFSPAHTQSVCAVLAAFWTDRLILELLFPIRVPLLYTQYTSDLLKMFCAALVALLLFPELKLQYHDRRLRAAVGPRRFENEPMDSRSSGRRIPS